MKILVISSCLLVAMQFNAQTTITTNITSNTTWSLAGSPYLVMINLTVFSGVTLTVDPGVTVKFGDGYEMDLRGQLVAIGTPADSITFTSASSTPSTGIWSGIRITGTTNPLGVGNQVTMHYCNGSYANRFVDMDVAYHGPYVFEHCTFTYNNIVGYDGGMPYVRYSECDFINNITGLNYNQFGGVARHCEFLNNVNGVDGFSNVDTCYFSGNTGIACIPYGSAKGNLIENNYIGVRSHFNAVNATFMYNVVTNNYIGVEIMTYFNGSITFQENTICKNTLYNIRMWTANNADLSDNCWCAEGPPDPAGIYDGYDDAQYGLVTTSPVSWGCPQAVGMEEVNAASFIIFPNPTSGIFYLQSTTHDATYNVYNVAGQLIAQGQVMNDSQATIDLSAEAAGMYVVQVIEGGRVHTQKLIVE